MTNRNPEYADMNQEFDSLDDSGERMSLRPLFLTLWGYRRVIAASISLIFFVFLVVALLIYLLLPAERDSSLEFQLTFPGADSDRYPNGLPFAAAEIIDSTILTTVYATDDLQRYCSYDQFKNGVFIFQSSKDLEFLDLEYRAKLSDLKLTSVDRSTLEKEFRQKQQAIHIPQYTLTFMTGRERARIPTALMSKVLNDILATWAEQAVNRKGVLSYQVRVYSSNVLLKEVLDPEDQIVRLDIIREKVNQILANVQELEKLPGSNLIRVGENRISLAEIEANLEDIRRFGLEPMLGTLDAGNVVQNPGSVTAYMEGRLQQSKLQQREATNRVAALRDALQTYLRSAAPGGNNRTAADSQPLVSGAPGVTLQLTDSFIERLMAMSNQSNDAQFRQKLTDQVIAANQIAVGFEKEVEYYENMVAAVHRLKGASRTTTDTQTPTKIAVQFDQIYKAVVRALAEIDDVYKEVSKQNLNPRTNLYTLTSPFVTTTQRVLTLSAIGLYGLVVLLMSFLLVPCACIMHHYFRQEIAPLRVSAAQPAERAEGNRAVGAVEKELLNTKGRSIGAD